MDNSTDASGPGTEFRADDFILNVRLVGNGPMPAAMSGDCTSDTCGSGNTSSSACTTNC
jgi:FxLD family lantipeptide